MCYCQVLHILKLYFYLSPKSPLGEKSIQFPFNHHSQRISISGELLEHKKNREHEEQPPPWPYSYNLTQFLKSEQLVSCRCGKKGYLLSSKSLKLFLTWSNIKHLLNRQACGSLGEGKPWKLAYLQLCLLTEHKLNLLFLPSPPC